MSKKSFQDGGHIEFMIPLRTSCKSYQSQKMKVSIQLNSPFWSCYTQYLRYRPPWIQNKSCQIYANPLQRRQQLESIF